MMGIFIAGQDHLMCRYVDPRLMKSSDPFGNGGQAKERERMTIFVLSPEILQMASADHNSFALTL